MCDSNFESHIFCDVTFWISKCHSGKPSPNCTRPGTGTVGLEDEEEEEVVSSKSTQSKNNWLLLV
jgi:hypothetical protein